MLLLCLKFKGILSARGDLILFADADGATSIKEVEKLEKRVASARAFVCGSRCIADDTCIVDVHVHCDRATNILLARSCQETTDACV